MFELIKYKAELRRLHALQRDLSLKIQGTPDRNDGELSCLGQEEDELENWIKYHQTQYCQHICQRLVVPMPDTDNNEYYNQFSFDDGFGDRNILTDVGLHYVRNKIREEKKARREAFGFWAAIITGLIGALIGLVSVIKG